MRSDGAVEIGPGDLGCLAEIARIEAATFSDAWSGAFIRQQLLAPQILFYVARAGGRIVGYAVLRCMGPEAEVYNLAVEAAVRQRGVGRALLTALLEDCGADTVYLEARASNAPALGLYRSLGFVPVGVRRGYYESPREDGVLLTYTKGSGDSADSGD